MMADELRYMWADIPVEEYARDLDEMWAELQRPGSALNEEAREFGIDASALRNIDRRDAIDVRTEGEGFDPVTVTLIVALAPVATEAIKVAAPIIHDVWNHILLPRILQRRGANALTPKE